MRSSERVNNKLILVNYFKGCLLGIVSFFVLITTANAVTVVAVPQEKEAVSVIETVSPKLGTQYTEQQVAELVKVYAIKHGVSQSQMLNTIKCESHYKNVQSGLYHSNGEREDSWGLAQINMYWHPEVSKAQALDPSFAVEFMAKQFSKGKASEWTCYRKLYQ